VDQVDVWKKKPATIVASRRLVAAQTQIMGAADRWALVAEMNRAARNGEVQVVRRQPVWNASAGQYEVVVRRLKDPAPRWRKPVLISSGVAVAFGALAGVGYYLATTTAGLALFTVAGLVTMMAFGAWLSRLGQRGAHAAVDVRVEVRVR